MMEQRPSWVSPEIVNEALPKTSAGTAEGLLGLLMELCCGCQKC